MASTFELDQSLKTSVMLALFLNVKNSTELKENILSGHLEATFIKPSFIIHEFEVLVAANKAVHSMHHKTLKTRSVFSEVLFNLSPSKKITEALKTFGIGDSDSEILVVLFNDNNGEKLKHVSNIINGELVSLDNLKQLCDEKLIKKMYKISDSESKYPLLDSVVSRIAVKDLVV